MELTWKYVTEVSDKDAFDKFAKEYGMEVPENIQSFVLKTNAGCPSKYQIDDINGNTRVFGGVLSYNREDDDKIYSKMRRWESKHYLPFGLDPFGNLYCVHILIGTIVWWNHETNQFVHIADSLEEMLEKLY